MRDSATRLLTVASLAGVLVLLVLIDIATFRNARALGGENVRRAQLTASLDDLRVMLSALKDGETAQRGYIITGAPDFLDPLRTGIPAARDKFHAVKAFGLVPAVDIDRLERLMEEKIQFLESCVRVRDTQGFEAAAAIVRSGEGKRRMDLVREQVARVEALYLRQMDAQQRAADRQEARTSRIILLSSALTLLMLGGTVVLMARDSTRRERAERALESEHRKLAATIKSVPYGLVLYDLAGITVLQNAAAEDLLKLPSHRTSQTDRLKIYRMLERDGRDIPPAQWPAQVALRGQRVVGREVLVERPDGSTIPLIVNAAPLLGAEGVLLGAVAGFQDITHLHEVNRLKDEFVSTVSHELRTPLTSIKGSLQLVLDDAASVPDPEYRELLAVALANTERLVRLINDILDISKIEAGRLVLKRQAVPPAELVRQATASIGQNTLDVRLQATVEPGVPRVFADPDRILQALLNLLSNAVKFAPPGTTVEIAAHRTGDGHVRFAVTDHGQGIPADKIDRLFRRFQQLDASSTRRTPGTGLGLAITKALVEEHGGRIEVVTAEGAGSTFSFTVPIADPAGIVQH